MKKAQSSRSRRRATWFSCFSASLTTIFFLQGFDLISPSATAAAKIDHRSVSVAIFSLFLAPLISNQATCQITIRRHRGNLFGSLLLPTLYSRIRARKHRVFQAVTKMIIFIDDHFRGIMGRQLSWRQFGSSSPAKLP
jgi:uncharacterized membrane protein YhaH (DUF805 family)